MAARKGSEIEAFVRRPDPSLPVILLYGPNGGLVAERAERLVRGFIGSEPDTFQLVRLDGDEIAGDALRLADEAHTIGLFGGRRVIRVRAGARNLLPAVQPLLSSPPTDTLVVIEAGDLQARNPLRTAVEASRSAVALPCYADEARDLAQIAEDMLSAEGLSLGREAREALLDQLGSDRMLVRREIEKLALYCKGRAAVTPDDVAAVMADGAGIAVDTVVDAAFLGDADGVDRGLVRLMQEGDDPGVIAGAALRHALLLHRSRIALDGGASFETVERAARLFFKRKAAFQRQVNRWSAVALEGAIATLREAQLGARRNAAIAPALLSRSFLTIAMRVRGR